MIRLGLKCTLLDFIEGPQYNKQLCLLNNNERKTILSQSKAHGRSPFWVRAVHNYVKKEFTFHLVKTLPTRFNYLKKNVLYV